MELVRCEKKSGGNKMKSLWLFIKANIFPLKMLLDYLRFSSKSELIFDLIVPVVFPFIIIPYLIEEVSHIDDLLTGIESINKQSLTSISILAGFNVASISVLATSGSNVLQSLRGKNSNLHPKVTLFEKIMTFFCAAVVIQFLIILIGIILLSILSFDISVENKSLSSPPTWLWLIIGSWIYLIIVSIFVSIRNLKTLFIIIVNGTDNPGGEKDT